MTKKKETKLAKAVKKVKSTVKKATSKKKTVKKNLGKYKIKKTENGFTASVKGRTPRTFKTKEMAEQYASKRAENK